jgi:putative transposase
MKRKRLVAARPKPATTLEIPRQGNRITAFEAGSTWSVRGERVAIVSQLTADRLLIRFTADDRTETVAVAELAPWVAALSENGPMGAVAPLELYSDSAWSRALEEYGIVNSFVERNDLSRAARDQIAQTLMISDRQLRRKLQRFRSLRSPEAFLPQRTGPAPGASHLHPDVENLMSDEIQRALKHSPDVAVDDLFPMVRQAAISMHLRPPARSTINSRLQRARRRHGNLPINIGRELSYRESPVRRSHGSDGPLSIVEMDHTVCDVHILDSVHGRPIGRPVLTLMIDRCTRVILGILLSLEAPSRLSVGLCLHHAVFPKLPWLTSLGAPEASWPGFGLPSVLYTDNAREFDALSLRRSVELYTIKSAFRPKGDPAAGGIIERAIGTFMTKVRLLPGASYSKLLGAKPRRADRLARFTLGDLSLYLARQVSVYHRSKHDGLGMAPLTAWENAWTLDGTPRLPRVPASADQFLMTFLPGEWRTVTREGIELYSLRYQSASLYPLIQRRKKLMVRFDPRDMSQVFVETRETHIPVPLVGAPMPAFSLWEWREVHARRREVGRPREIDEIAREVRANRELIESRAADKDRWHDARRVEREKEWIRSRSTLAKPDRVIRSMPLDAVPRCRVKE